MKKTGPLLNYIQVCFSLAIRGKWEDLSMFLKTSYALLITDAPVVKANLIIGPVRQKI